GTLHNAATLGQQDNTSGLDDLPVFAPASDNPQKKQSESAAEGVENDVPNRGLPRRHESLMDLVAGRIERDDNKSGTCVRPEPGARVGGAWLSQGAPNEHGENGIFGDMRGLADSKDNRVN